MIKKFIKKILSPLSSKETLTLKKTGLQRYDASTHRIDTHMVSRNAIKVCETLQQKGFEAYIVGGAVRDLMLGIPPKDFDVATNATPEQVQRAFRRARIIGRRFKLVHVVFGREIIETSTFRASGSDDIDEHGRVLRDNVYGTLEEDAIRRDFTLNALYYDPSTQTVLDFHGGVHDIKSKRITIIGEPEQRYREDPVRMLRAIRFASKLGFAIDAKTAQPIRELSSLISNVPESRLFDELVKLLSCGNALHCLYQLRQFDFNKVLLPAIDQVLDTDEGRDFIQLGLERTDQRVNQGRSISPSFLFAVILWCPMQRHLTRHQSTGIPLLQALHLAIDDVVYEQSQYVPIQRRFVSDVREIWAMQPRFEKRLGKTPWKMVEQDRFRAACDFLQIRAATHDTDSQKAQWWMDFADGDDDQRKALITKANQEDSQTSPNPNKRKRRYKSRSRADKSHATPVDA